MNMAKRRAAVCGLRSAQIGGVDLERTLSFLRRFWGLSTVAAEAPSLLEVSTIAYLQRGQPMGAQRLPSRKQRATHWEAPS